MVMERQRSAEVVITVTKVDDVGTIVLTGTGTDW